MTTTFTLAQQTDLPTIVDIYNQSISSRLATADLIPVTVASKEDWFTQFTPDHYPIWLIQVDGQTAGWVSLEAFYGRPAYSKTAEISIYIDSRFHHQGLGQQALDYVFPQLQTLGLNTIVAFIFHHNQASQGLFLKNGFTRWGHLPQVADMDGQLRDLDILGKHFN